MSGTIFPIDAQKASTSLPHTPSTSVPEISGAGNAGRDASTTPATVDGGFSVVARAVSDYHRQRSGGYLHRPPHGNCG